MFRFAAAVLVSSACASDETSLMQGLKPSQDVTQRSDKSKQISSLMATATSMLKNGATPDVVEFAAATLSEITSIVFPAILDAHATDQALVDHTFTMFETALLALEEGTEQIKILSDEERRQSAFHKLCRDEEEGICLTKQICDYDLYAIWRRFIEEESILREYSGHVTSHFCAPDVNGTLQIFRDGAVVLFPPWLEQKPIVETVEVEFGIKRPDCETKYVILDDKTEVCDAYQTALENAACAHGRKVYDVRVSFRDSWQSAVSTYQHVVDEVHCLEIDRWKEWRTLSTVQCLLDRTTERNGRPCDETTDEVVTEVAHCEQVQYDTSVDHLMIVYYTIPEYPPLCHITPWDVAMANPGRCIPRTPETPCNSGFIAQEYAELWTPPQPEFFGGVNFLEGNSHCNQRPECVECVMDHECIMLPVICILPQPTDECHFATRAQLASGHYDAVDVVGGTTGGGFPTQPPVCCEAMIPECLGCQAGMTGEEYCAGNPIADVCFQELH